MRRALHSNTFTSIGLFVKLDVIRGVFTIMNYLLPKRVRSRKKLHPSLPALFALRLRFTHPKGSGRSDQRQSGWGRLALTELLASEKGAGLIQARGIRF